MWPARMRRVSSSRSMVSGEGSAGSSVCRARTEGLTVNSGLSHTPCRCSSSSEPPGIQDTQQETLEADVGTPLVLTCRVTGVAVPTVTWLKDGRPLGVCAGECCARLPPPASLLIPSKHSCLSFSNSNPATRDSQGCTGRGQSMKGLAFSLHAFRRSQVHS